VFFWINCDIFALEGGNPEVKYVLMLGDIKSKSIVGEIKVYVKKIFVWAFLK
jgi:hypothetical protein